MATAQISNVVPSPYGGSHTHQQALIPRLYDLPRELSSAQLEAKQILAHLLNRLKETESTYYNRYGKWVERHPRLEDFCFQCIRPQVWTFLGGRWSLDALKTIGGDLKFEGRSVYLDGVLGLDRRVRVYIGQATSLRQRVAQHLNFRYRRDNPSLHYHAMQYSIYNTIGCLATLPSPNSRNPALPGMDCPDLLLNVLEMWMCLMFRTLPSPILDVWLPEVEGVSKGRKKGKEGEFGGLNITSPLDQGDRQRHWIDLSDSDDPLVLEYINLTQQSSIDKKKEEQTGAKGQDTPAERRKKYAETARRQRDNVQNGIHVPQWFVLGGLAVGLGLILLSSRGGPQPQSRVHFRS
ncbi:Nn.00g019100.m01.CDS01 [Neocucurbitaria sp. VM-36]